MGLLNSVLLSWYYQCVHPTEVDKPMAQVKKNFVEDLPVIVGNRDQISTVFEQKVQEVAAFTSQIKKLQSQLDDEVFAIYGIDSAAADLIHSEMVIKL